MQRKQVERQFMTQVLQRTQSGLVPLASPVYIYDYRCENDSQVEGVLIACHGDFIPPEHLDADKSYKNNNWSMQLGYLEYKYQKNSSNGIFINCLESVNVHCKYVGSLLLEALFCKSIENNRGGKIYLESFFGSWPFYYKFGFRAKGLCADNYNRQMEEYMLAHANNPTILLNKGKKQ